MRLFLKISDTLKLKRNWSIFTAQLYGFPHNRPDLPSRVFKDHHCEQWVLHAPSISARVTPPPRAPSRPPALMRREVSRSTSCTGMSLACLLLCFCKCIASYFWLFDRWFDISNGVTNLNFAFTRVSGFMAGVKSILSRAAFKTWIKVICLEQ